jgi:hypothetical protein
VQRSLGLRGKTNQKVFVKLTTRVTNTNCIKIRYFLRNGVGGTLYPLANLGYDNPIQNTYYTMYANIDITENGTDDLYLMVQHEYVDSTTANGKVMEVQNVMALDLTSLGLENLSADQVNAMLPVYFEGLQSVTKDMKVTSVGANLFDGKVEVGTIDATTGATSSFIQRARNIGFVSIKPNTQYIIKLPTNYSINRIFFYDSNKVYISNIEINLNQKTFATPINANFTKLAFTNPTMTDITQVDLETLKTNIMLNEGTVALPYQPYQQASITLKDYTDKELHKINSTLYDEVIGDKRYGRLKSYTLQASDIVNVVKTYTNLDYVQIKKPLDAIFYGNTNANVNSLLFGNVLNVDVNNFVGLFDSTNMIGKVTVQPSAPYLWLGVAKGTYAD